MPAIEAHILLVGFMGSGKSSVAGRLATQLGCTCWDLDERVEERYSLPIPCIFQRLGEIAFRRAEGWELSRLLFDPAAVIALGGGAFHSRNRKLISPRSITVWLDTELQLSWERCRNDPNRPLASDRQTFEHLYKQRRIDYQNALHRIRISHQRPREIVREIQELLV